MTIIKLKENLSLDLPADLAEKLGLSPGDSLTADVDQEGRLLLTPVPAVAEPPQASLKEAITKKNLATSMQFIKGIGPKLAETLARKGINTVEDALYLLPNRYEDRSTIVPIARLALGSTQVFQGEVAAAEPQTTKGGRRYFEVLLKDTSGVIHLKWFNFNPVFMKRTWRIGRRGIFTGHVGQYGLQREVHHPEVEWLADGEEIAAVLSRDTASFGRIVPVYPLTEGLSQKIMRKVLKEVVERFVGFISDHLPPDLRHRHKLLPIPDALAEVHFPESVTDITVLNRGDFQAHRTLVFDEFFYLELGMALKRQGVVIEEGIGFSVTHKYTKPLLQMLPFQLTTAQRRVLTEIKEDMMTPHPMHRLVQGDVGSGKTLVALMAALVAVENGYQVAIMAPTEILAEQHFLNIHRWCELLGVSVVLLTSSFKGKARTAALASIADGSAQIVIGTHAVIQDKVEFHRLGMGIVDEQHRFGVLQRGILRKKGENPDILVMTATPIPRTLAMTVFGDLSLSVIDELPPGRTPIETRLVFESRRSQVYAAIREEVNNGRQAYLIYPLVEETEKSELKAASQMAEHLQNDIFPDLKVGLLHGRMKPEEKEAVMRSFKAQETEILVATTVIEVGIDVPNATIMVIEHAERFGLSQLHQLRGRVGRGSAKSKCFLLTSGRLSEDGEKRLRVMESTNDGFRIAEADLEIRGPGDFLGTRQAGLPDFRVANILRDGRILEEARKEAFTLVEQDPGLKQPHHAAIREELARRWGGRLELAGVA
ncbi:ATP-dependent DNA helicase RecG [Geobacter pelophilus]|uniref:ATP-dependent DNA helicase RecG n=1 Tax=Geoanaerobacter pelophilus TaxID=60036 RepID=A0AAW4L942_9BACT|nr:ATP-dependent DNA helicase RecG [Geoanaerobacter pelophilus]MBT0664357.1 ATP-dependent DNA helicase RecG [Geoanaerobacter pelophilus]